MSERKRKSTSAKSAENKTSRKRGRPRKKGLGDVTEQVIKSTGLDVFAKAYTKITGKDCGCQKRKDLLNKKGRELMNLFFQGNKFKCPTDLQRDHIMRLEIYNDTNTKRQRIKSHLSAVQIVSLHNEITGVRMEVPTCNCQATVDTLATAIKRLQGICEMCQA